MPSPRSLASSWQAHDLASLTGTCSELRHLGSADELWRPLFEREFPHAPAFYKEQVRWRGATGCDAMFLRLDARQLEGGPG